MGGAACDFGPDVFTHVSPLEFSGYANKWQERAVASGRRYEFCTFHDRFTDTLEDIDEVLIIGDRSDVSNTIFAFFLSSPLSFEGRRRYRGGSVVRSPSPVSRAGTAGMEY